MSNLIAMEVQVELTKALSNLNKLNESFVKIDESTKKGDASGKTLNSTYTKTSDTFKEVSKNIDKTATSSDKLDKSTNKSGKEAKNTADEFKKMGKETEEAGVKGKKKIEELGNETENTSRKTGVFADVLKANITFEAIKEGARAVYEFGKTAVESSTKFHNGMNEVFTLLPGISSSSMKKMENDVKSFAKEFGVLPEEEIPALYQALSAGVPQDNVFEFLKTAQKGAVGGVSDLETAVDGLSSVVNAFGKESIDAGRASDIMFTAVKQGKTTFAEISGSVSQVAPLAASMGVKFEDIAASLSTLTSQGTPTSEAMTQLKGVFSELSQGSSKVSAEFKKITGKSFKDFVAGGGDTKQALDLLNQAAGKSGKGINELFGSVEAGSAALALTGKGSEKFATDLEAMRNSAGATDKAYAQMQQGLQPTINKLKASFSVAMTGIGDSLAPALGAMGNAALGIFPLLDQMGVYFQNPAFAQFGEIVLQMGQILGASLGPALSQIAATLGGAVLTVVNTFNSQGSAMKLIVEAIGNVFTVLGSIFSMVVSIIAQDISMVIGYFAQMYSGFVKAAGLTGTSGKQLSQTLSTAFTTIGQIISGIYQFISPILNMVAFLIGTFVGGAVKILLDLFKILAGAINAVGGFFKKIFNKKDAEDSKQGISGVTKNLKDLAKAGEEAGKPIDKKINIDKKENIEMNSVWKNGQPPTSAPIPQASNAPSAPVKLDDAGIKQAMNSLGTTMSTSAAQQGPQIQQVATTNTANGTKLDAINQNQTAGTTSLKAELEALKAEVSSLKNALSAKLDNVANAIRNRNVIVNVNGVAPDEIVSRIKASLEKG